MASLFENNRQTAIVSSFAELMDAQYDGKINAVCWERNLKGDFKEIVTKLQLKENITEVTVEDLLALELSEQGYIARETILEDLRLLTESGALPSLNLLKCYERDEEFNFISTDVYSFHIDRSPVATDTILCTYFGAASEIIENNKVQQKIHIPEIRAQLKKLYQGKDEDFNAFLEENFFDLHYEMLSQNNPTNLGLGNLWKLAVGHPEQKVWPCVHRAPKEKDGEYRLLLIC